MQAAFYVAIGLIIAINLVIAIMILENKGYKEMMNWRNWVIVFMFLTIIFTLNMVYVNNGNINSLQDKVVELKQELLDSSLRNAELEVDIFELNKNKETLQQKVINTARQAMILNGLRMKETGDLLRDLNVAKDMVLNLQKKKPVCPRTNYITKKIYISKKCSVY